MRLPSTVSTKWRSERGQAILLVALVLPVLLLAIGVVVEGSYAISEYRSLQAAADIAAMAGAEDLPCGTTDSSCIAAAEKRACDYAGDNGFGCTPGAIDSSSANVPPISCSPYDFIDYGNSGTNPHCKAGGSVSVYGYLEVRLYKQIPAPPFAPSVTLYAHAVARHGQISPKRFAIIVLDSSQSRALKLSGSAGGGLIAEGPVVSDSTASDSIYSGGSSVSVSCSGEWYTSANEIAPPSGPAANITSNTGGTANFAPPGCLGGSTDTPTQFISSYPPVPDPYAASTVPTGNMSNCTPCNANAYYYTWPTGNRQGGTWAQASSTSAVSITNGVNAELFPGIYPNGISISGGNVYLNPGVYTIQNGLSTTGGTMCIYGAPACDAGVSAINSTTNCSTASFASSASDYVPSGNWYYYCSPWGIWDPTMLPGRPSSLMTAPTFTDGITPLNGVTFYMESGNLKLNGNGASYLAFPNPCPGTGSFSANSVDFPAGSSGASYTYPAGSVPAQDGIPSSGSVYPNADLSYAAECSQAQPPNARDVWSGEMDGQHLHFLIFARSPSVSITLNGTGLQNWWGIIYSPGTDGCGSACNVTVTGSGGSADGPPLLAGQVIADNETYSGTAHFEIFYSPCRPNGDICAAGFGTSLVE